jgi:UDPglucose 6-dehydrogenase
MTHLKIAITDTFYVGLSNAVLVSQAHEVVVIDVVPENVAMLKANGFNVKVE